MRTPYFRVFQDRAGEYRWTMHAGNGEPVATSEGYRAHSGAESSAKRVKYLAPLAVIKDETVDAALARLLNR